MTSHLIAFATNCISPERAEIEWTLATQGPDGNWYDWQGHRYYQFHVSEPIDFPTLTVPPGWIDHIQSIARQNVSEQKRAEPAFDLTAALGITMTKAPTRPFTRRI